MAQKIIYWLVITLIFALGFGQLLRYDLQIGTVYFHDFLIITILLLMVPQFIQSKFNDFSLPTGIRIFILGLGIGWVRALTLYPIADLIIPFMYSLRILAYLSLYFLLRKSGIQIPRIIFIISGLTTLVIGISQYFLMPDMRIFQYLGWDDHLNRVTLPHFDPTFTAIMLVLAAFMIPVTQWYIAIFLYFAILLTYSRSIWLSLLLTGLLIIKNKAVSLLAAGCMLFAILLLPIRFGEGNNLFRTYSISSRANHDLDFINSMRFNLLTGVGMNNFERISISEKGYPNHVTGPNNSYLYLLGTSGILGLIGFLIFFKEIYQKSLYKPMIIFILIASLFNNALFYPFALLWILLSDATNV